MAELETYKAEKARQLSELEGHAFYLLDYANALATVLANFEKVSRALRKTPVDAVPRRVRCSTTQTRSPLAAVLC